MNSALPEGKPGPWRIIFGNVHTVIDCVICSARIFVEMVDNAPEGQYSCPVCGSNNEWFHLEENPDE